MGGIVHFNNTLAVFPHVKLKSFFSPISVYLLVLDSSQSIYCESEIFLISVTFKIMYCSSLGYVEKEEVHADRSVFAIHEG